MVNNKSYYLYVELFNMTNTKPSPGSQVLFQIQGKISGGNFKKDDCCSPKFGGACNCRTKNPNLIVNGDFSLGNTGFTSTYAHNPGNVSSNLVIPGQFKVVKQIEALTISPNWQVQDLNMIYGNFLVVNGKTTQPLNTSSVVWQQTVTGLEKDSTYKLCLSLKNLPQSTFDIKPQVSILSSPWMTVSTTSSVTDWMQYNTTFIATSSTFVIKVLLKEDIAGDGNDLAIDNIGLVKLSKVPLRISHMQDNNVITASLNSLPPVIDDNLPSGCKGVWTIGIPTIGSPQTITDLSPRLTNNTWQLTTTFPGYPINPLVTLYGVILTVTGCDCYADNMVVRLISTGNLKTPANNNEIIISKKLKEKIFNEVKKPENKE